MAIYGRTGNVVTMVRRAVIGDVRALDARKPDKQDHEAIKAGSYVVVRQDDGKLRLYHQAFLRADGGSREITNALEAVDPWPGCSCPECPTCMAAGCTTTVACRAGS